MEKQINFPLLYSGSVKDVHGLEGQDPYIFSFSNRYSIFDWGEMPNLLEGKGEALAVMGDLFFRYLGDGKNWQQWQISEKYPKFWRDSFTTSNVWKNWKRSGLPHHSFGLVSEELKPLPLGKKSSFLSVKAKTRPAVSSAVQNGVLKFDYSAYGNRPSTSLVPLEVVFRFGAPEGSSFLERVEKNPGYAESFGFSDVPRAGEWFPYPIVEFFTKLEPTDRFLTRDEAREIAALTPEEMDDLTAFTLLLALRLKDIFSSVGLELWDGKFEFAFLPGSQDSTSASTSSAGDGKRGFELVDSIGPDELRLIGPGGVHFSKEFLRRVYRNTPWFEAMARAKKLAKERGEKNWKKICREELGQNPEPLTDRALQVAENLYPVLVQEIGQTLFQQNFYDGLPSLAELCKQMKEIQ